MSFFTDNINPTKVLEAIEAEPLTCDFRNDAKNLVWRLGTTYAERDFNECEIICAEEKFNSKECAGTIDLKLRIKEPKYLPKESKGKALIIDWKTSNTSTFDAEFKRRYTGSWQWQIYSHYAKADYFEYRIISKFTGETKDITIEVPPLNSAIVLDYLESTNNLIRTLRETNTHKWPQHMPFACKAYNRVCPHKAFCDEYTYKDFLPVEVLHYTTAETFYLCPERYRLDEMNKNMGQDSEATALGSAVHRGMEEIYKQLMEKQNGSGK